MMFSPTNYRRLQSRLSRAYAKKFSKILAIFKKNPWVWENRDVLKEYSSVNWFYLKQLEDYLFYYNHQEDLSEDDSFSKIDDAVFESWNRSEFSAKFLKFLNQGSSLSEANEKTLAEFSKHLIDLGNRHVLKIDKVSKAYLPQSSLGDIKKAAILKRLFETTLHLDGIELKLFTHNFKEMESFSHRIEKSLKLIKIHSPDSWERFKAFTAAIIPIKDKEFVSYSHQELPGYSMINLYDRDAVDLLDDLLHENGHHHLNYYLNLGKLIDEPVDLIYYSPWRRTLRPLRGIYHAYFTFFWAFKLFVDLYQGQDQETFSAKENQKILWRTLEEFHMLNYTYKDLVWAKKKGLINETGWNLIEAQQSILKKMKPKLVRWEKDLKNKTELKNLKKTLEKAAKEFKK
jgi:hypothetical protein